LILTKFGRTGQQKCSGYRETQEQTKCSEMPEKGNMENCTSRLKTKEKIRRKESSTREGFEPTTIRLIDPLRTARTQMISTIGNRSFGDRFVTSVMEKKRKKVDLYTGRFSTCLHKEYQTLAVEISLLVYLENQNQL
jgi:hypothetical protein